MKWPAGKPPSRANPFWQFDACMNAHGWALTNQVATGPYKEALEALSEEAKAQCLKVEYQSYFLKSPCDTRSPTAEQLADKSRITPAEKATLTKLRAEGRAIADRTIAAHRQYGEKRAKQLPQTLNDFALYWTK